MDQRWTVWLLLGRSGGCYEGGMLSNKLLRRMEDVLWALPILSFRIERHGGTDCGSTRARSNTEKLISTAKRLASSGWATGSQSRWRSGSRSRPKSMMWSAL